MPDRLYYADSFLRAFTATVTDIREFSRDDQQSLWQIALDRSAFYPTSGGQPYDRGVLRATSRQGSMLEVPVSAVEEDEAGEVWHFVSKPLLPGTPVEGEIDWARRLDHMQQHSGQHLLSAVFAQELQASTVSFHLGEQLSTIDLDVPRLSPTEVEEIERKANLLIAEDRPVRVLTVSREEADAMLAAGKLRKLPERAGDLRVIEIANYDLNACGGTHVSSTGQIAGLLIRSLEKVSRGVRVSYVCGLRAVDTARRDAGILAQAAASLSVGTPAIPEGIERLKTENKGAAKERQKLREELAAYQAARLAVEVPIGGGLRWVEREMDDRDIEYLRVLASSLSASVPQTVALFSTRQGDTARMVLGRSRDLEFHCGETLKAALAPFGLRGGGSADLAQSEVPARDLPGVLKAISGAVRRGASS